MGQYTPLTRTQSKIRTVHKNHGTHSTEDGTVYTTQWDTPQRVGQYTHLARTHSKEGGTVDNSPGHIPQRVVQYTQLTGIHSTEGGTVDTTHRDTLHRGWAVSYTHLTLPTTRSV